MILKRIFERISGKNFHGKTIVITPGKSSENAAKELWNDPDKSIFEIRDSFKMNDRGTVIYGRVKRGFFRVGDMISICNPTDTIEKISAEIMKIVTPLVESNRINCGSEADILVTVYGDSDEILPGDRAYKKTVQEELKNAIQ